MRYDASIYKIKELKEFLEEILPKEYPDLQIEEIDNSKFCLKNTSGTLELVFEMKGYYDDLIVGFKDKGQGTRVERVFYNRYQWYAYIKENSLVLTYEGNSDYALFLYIHLTPPHVFMMFPALGTRLSGRWEGTDAEGNYIDEYISPVCIFGYDKTEGRKDKYFASKLQLMSNNGVVYDTDLYQIYTAVGPVFDEDRVIWPRKYTHIPGSNTTRGTLPVSLILSDKDLNLPGLIK